MARLARRVQDHDLLGLAAEIAYRFLFAVFPLGLFVAALGSFAGGLLHVADPTAHVMSALGDNLPAPLAEALQPDLARVLQHARPDLVSGGAIAALIAATGGTNALIKGMNRAYDVEETRPFVLRYALAVGLTVLGAVAVIASFVTIVGGALLTQKLATQLGIVDGGWAAVQVLRWPGAFAALTVAVALLYRFGPNLVAPFRTILVGAAAFAVAWILATLVLSVYVTRVADYGATYGSLAAVIVLMLWFYVTAFLLVAGAEVVVEATRRWAPGSLRRRPTEVEAERALEEGKEDAAAVAGHAAGRAAADVRGKGGQRRGSIATSRTSDTGS